MVHVGENYSKKITDCEIFPIRQVSKSLLDKDARRYGTARCLQDHGAISSTFCCFRLSVCCRTDAVLEVLHIGCETDSYVSKRNVVDRIAVSALEAACWHRHCSIGAGVT